MVDSLFLCQNLTMEDILHTILNPYVSVSEKDILCEMQRLHRKNQRNAQRCRNRGRKGINFQIYDKITEYQIRKRGGQLRLPYSFNLPS